MISKPMSFHQEVDRKGERKEEIERKREREKDREGENRYICRRVR
jgi:hypothetical protein